MTTANPTGGPTTGGPTTGSPTTDEPTTGSPTTDEPTTDDTSDPTSGGEDPFCGDGNVDAGEECDDGLENNGLKQGCLPDCNLNVCGDSNIGPDEFCDDGEGDNVLEVGACAPDCSTVVEEKVLTVGTTIESGLLSPNPVAAADATCAVGSSAMFVFPGGRRATTTAWETDDPLDWVLAPWTVYVRATGELIWATDETALLGVRSGENEPLINSILEESGNGWGYGVVTGLNGEWTTAISQNCNGWNSSAATVVLGLPTSVLSPAYLRNGAAVSCNDMVDCVVPPGSGVFCERWTTFYCVEQ